LCRLILCNGGFREHHRGFEWIGCDAHKQFSVFVEINSKGKTSPAVRVAHHWQEYIDFLHTLPLGSEIALEATGHWYWMVDEMEKAGHRPHLANPTRPRNGWARPIS
jgi:hypothetical protein